MEEIKYVALGDSYTIGEGATKKESWPSLMVENLTKEGWNITLVANPSVTGWTSKDLIEKELPVFDKNPCQLATLLIGVNDWVQEVSAEAFKENLNTILNHVQLALPDPQKLVIISIPDFGVTPEGAKYSKGRDISKGITEFNKILEQAAVKRNLPFVDIFPLTQEMKGNQNLIAKDGLHPSAEEYSLWEPLIRKAVMMLFP